MDFSGRGHTIYIRKAQSTAFSVILAIVGFGEWAQGEMQLNSIKETGIS